MSTHTPGPWHVANGCQIRSAKDQIAKAWMMRNGEGLANARLIAAAPEMLEALEEIVCAADGDGWSQLDADLRKARAAIASGEVKRPTPTTGFVVSCLTKPT